ncbi:MAG: helicase [Chitinophagaceae bacterium]|nr:MAG: helicase [Chitinophagaceae bacterium]
MRPAYFFLFEEKNELICLLYSAIVNIENSIKINPFDLPIDTSNIIFQQAVAFVTQTNQHLFLTGKAGTGKTTFLKYIVENCFKKLAVVAPTGVAAINAGGVTLHSFFQLPFGMFIPDHPAVWGGVDSAVYNKNELLGKLRLNHTKRDLIRELDLLIIDEVSMVRADLLDAVDIVLRSVRRRHHDPFGGVQMLFIGDLFQLPPVIKDNEKGLFFQSYKSPFFFDSKVIHEAPPVYLALKKIYRQEDEKFIHLLNNIRNNRCTDEDLHHLHRYYQPDFSPDGEDGTIILTTHNYKADAINKHQLAKLPGKTCKFEAGIKGEFPENAYPVDAVLHLKTGAQVMFIKNDKGETRRYYNGKIGVVNEIDEEEGIICISFAGEKNTMELPLETWRNIRYKYDHETDKIGEEEIGSFTHYPVRLAWAVTIHKSQGLTFDKAVIDAGASFAAGQVYVALSRLTGMDGLILHSRINPQNILTDADVIAFSHTEKPKEIVNEILETAQLESIHRSLLETFDWNKLLDLIHSFIKDTSERSIPDKSQEIGFLNGLSESLMQESGIAGKFQLQMENLLQQRDEEGYRRLHERVMKATDWFTKDLGEKVIAPLQQHIKNTGVKSKTKKYVKELNVTLLIAFMKRQEQLKRAVSVTTAMQDTSGAKEVMRYVTEMHQPVKMQLPAGTAMVKKPEKGASQRITLELYREGISLEEIAAARNLTRGTIEGHLAAFIASGEVDIHFLIAPGKLADIMNLLQSHPDIRSSEVRDRLGPDFSYSEIRAATEFWKINKHSTKK